MMNTSLPQNCDIFCNVIDNYGDIGVCWRLARQFTHEYGLSVRLWVDDLSSFVKLCPDAKDGAVRQFCRDVEVCAWMGDFTGVTPANLVIEAFGCRLPENYIAAMVGRAPIWINLEYLSAEAWVEGCHELPSPHPTLALMKYFFFPGFTPKTGGLILERDLLARRDKFPNHAAVFWQSIGRETPDENTLTISLFGYENAALSGLLAAWANGNQRVLCLVPEGRILPQVIEYFDKENTGCTNSLLETSHSERIDSHLQQGNLTVQIIPFVAQENYDPLLWACDINFVRGEDSCVRAQWAAKPFVWQIYPQDDGAHWAKLDAFLNLYHADTPDLATTTRAFWQAWNMGDETTIAQAWKNFIATREPLRLHAQRWAQHISHNNLALNLLDFCQKIGRIRAFKIVESSP
ncbi:MAG: elongation factor P maturation arginine rhamnosyltransferase EarP [Gallionella sp.]|nr:elongation factor P maturation arginine rhamnosyltransferase EarP [Gallionella sp.]MDD4959487.1 elongation factor P maturation arginine rhamnosyltransferase EarP [Gallionella sp.]